MILLDLDNFKKVNDQFGHQTGDDVLIAVAAKLKSLFRSRDIISRLGGDEFVVYMRGVPEEEWAKSRADQITDIAMYQAKKSGGNRSVRYLPESAGKA